MKFPPQLRKSIGIDKTYVAKSSDFFPPPIRPKGRFCLTESSGKVVISNMKAMLLPTSIGRLIGILILRHKSRVNRGGRYRASH